MRTRFSPFVAAVAYAFTLVLAPAAMAAPATWQRVDVTLHAEESGGMLLISGELPETVTLPAEAELSAPAGSQVQWIGQILGGDLSTDPALQYAKSTEGAIDIYRFTLTESRTAQLEVPITDQTSFDGTIYRASLIWTPTQNVPEVRMGVKIGDSATVVKEAAGASIVPGERSYSYYSKTVADALAGQPLDLSFTYTAPAATAATSGASTNSSTPIAIVLIVAAAALVVFAIALSRKSNSGAPEASAAKASDRATKATVREKGLTGRDAPSDDMIFEGVEETIPLPEDWQKLTSENRRLTQEFIQTLLRSQRRT